MHLFITLLTIGFLLSPAVKAEAQDSVQNIVKSMKEALEPVRPSTRKVVLSMTAEGETVQWVAYQARKQFQDGQRMAMVLTEPAEVKGNAYVAWERREGPTAIWVYMPILRRVRELVEVDAYEHFLGTDFTYADLGFVCVHPHYQLLGEEVHNGTETYKIEETVPEERAYYSRITMWVTKDSMLPLQRDYYDVGGTLWKTELFETDLIDGVPTPVRIQMKDLQGKMSTSLAVREVSYDVTLPDTLFDPGQLPVLGESPVWHPARTPAAAGK